MSAPASLGLDPTRAVDPAGYAMSGRAPHAAVRPETREELAEALRAATRDGLGVVPWGGGVALSREPAPARFDVALDLRGLNRVVEYESDDLTLTAECGVTLETLRATLGGVLAANASGARRLALGAPRDRVLGARYALGDGTLARSGGKVVKNVAGYGIHRLLCGSRGGLAVIVEASLKLLPAPAARVAMVYGLEPARVADEAGWARVPRLMPAALTVIGHAAADLNPVLATRAPFTLVVGFEGEPPDVEHQCELVHDLLGAARVRVTGESAVQLWQALADLEELQGARLTLTTSANTPAALAALGDDLVLARAVFHAACGRLHLFPPAERAQELAGRLAAQGFALIDARGAGTIEPAIPPQLAVQAMRRQIRAALDPARRFALAGD